MNDKEKKLSDYIDSLNDERKPDEHGSELETQEMEEIFETVRLLKSLKEPNIPDKGYYKKLAEDINNELNNRRSKKSIKRWLLGGASIAAAAALIITLNIVKPFGRDNVVYAMEEAFKDVKAYHGVLEIVEKNVEGKSTLQSKVEVWADKEGRYYVKGLEGSQKDLITANDGQKKWQVQPDEKEVDVFSAFPDPYSFTFELGKEIEDVGNAVKTEVVGAGVVAGRAATVVKVTPQGGSPYKIWIDKETNMPLQKQSAMDYSLQYTVRYDNIDFIEAVPKDLLVYSVPKGFKEVNTNPEQVVNNIEEAEKIVGFTPKVPQNISPSFTQRNITVENKTKTVKINYVSNDNKKVSVLQKKASGEFKPESTSILAKINDNVAEVQEGLEVNSVRWQQDGFEYNVVGNASLEELSLFIKDLANGTLYLSEESFGKPQVEVAVDLEAEKGDQKNVDEGHSPWKLDPAFVAQVFVSLKISPEGIVGDYPIDYEELKIVQNNGKEAVVEVASEKTPISKVYLKRLVRQDNTGIWTVVGYDAK
jgi:outer membrane lipoprotein-sorting protein